MGRERRAVSCCGQVTPAFADAGRRCVEERPASLGGVGQMGGKGKGGAKSAWIPPARSRVPEGGDGGMSITDKIKARKAAGGAEAWDEYKARIQKQQQEQHALEHWDTMMSAQHREVLDRERAARLAGAGPSEAPDAKRHKSKKRKHKDHKKEKHKKEKHKKHKKRKRRSDSTSSSSSESDGDAKRSRPARLSEFLAHDSDGDAAT